MVEGVDATMARSELRATLHHLSIPMRSSFRNAQITIGARSVGLVEVTVDGLSGWGEASPYPGQDEPMEDLVAGVASGSASPVLAAGLSQARADLDARIRGESLGVSVGSTRAQLPMSIAVSLELDPVDVVRNATGHHVNRFKVKVAPGEIDHVIQIRENHPECLLGVDANGSFDADTIGEMARLAPLDLLYIEQPCDLTDERTLGRLKEAVDVPVLADESVRSASDAAEHLVSGLIDGVVVKPGRLGWEGALETIGVAEALGKRWRASGMLESGIGRAFTNLLAAKPTAFVSDVAPGNWYLEKDLVTHSVIDGELVVPTGAGIGVDPDPAVMERYFVGRYDLTSLVTQRGDRDLG